MGTILAPDDLGEAGERLFAGLCSRVPLVCNKSERDRTGWDFVVEFPMPEDRAATSLDARQPTACSVQLKSTTLAGPVQASLSSMERLAKDPRPSFLVVFRLEPDGTGRFGYLVPMLGPPLRRILKRLRSAQAGRRFDLNKLRISFDYRALGERFALTPEGLAGALQRACGDDRDAYVSEKQRQLQELGYEDGGWEAEATVWIENADHLSDVILGLEPLKPQSLRAFDTRFGIRLPYAGAELEDLEELRLTPPSMGPCIVSVRGAGLTPAAVFEAEMFVGLAMPAGEGVWLLVKHAEFTLKFSASAAAFATTHALGPETRSLAGWIPLMRALSHLATGDSTITVTPSNHVEASIPLSVAEPIDGPYLDKLPAALGILEGWQRIVQYAGLAVSGEFSWADLTGARPVALAVALFETQPGEAWFSFDRTALQDPEGSVSGLYVNTASLGGASVSFAVKVTLEVHADHPDEYRSTRFEPIDARPAVPDLQDYAEMLGETHEIRVIINPANLIEIDPDDLQAG